MPQFASLPVPKAADGTPRTTGVEIEFSGLDVARTAGVIAKTLGGDAGQDDSYRQTVSDTQIGDITIELDTALRDMARDMPVVAGGLKIAGDVIPVEIVTEPLDLQGLDALNTLLPALRDAGAQGSRAGVLFGFGVHLNPGIVGTDAVHTFRTVQAFALLEPNLRRMERLDPTRRALPFVAPWPAQFVTELLRDDIADMADLLRRTAAHVTSRNHGLDLFPMLKQAEPDLFAQLIADDKSAARPTFHFRLPDCRIDEPGWSLARPWALWHLVETVAADAETFDALRDAWLADAARWSRPGHQWADRADEILNANEIGCAA